MTVRAVLLAAISMVALSTSALAAPPLRPSFRKTVLTGVIRSLGVVQEEPRERPQATFLLDVVQSDGRTLSVLTVLPAPIPCAEGDRAMLSGDFAKEGLGGPMLLSAHILSCGA